MDHEPQDRIGAPSLRMAATDSMPAPKPVSAPENHAPPPLGGPPPPPDPVPSPTVGKLDAYCVKYDVHLSDQEQQRSVATKAPTASALRTVKHPRSFAPRDVLRQSSSTTVLFRTTSMIVAGESRASSSPSGERRTHGSPYKVDFGASGASPLPPTRLPGMRQGLAWSSGGHPGRGHTARLLTSAGHLSLSMSGSFIERACS